MGAKHKHTLFVLVNFFHFEKFQIKYVAKQPAQISEYSYFLENLENGLRKKTTPMFCRNSCTADFTFHMFMFILPYLFYLHTTQTPKPSTCCKSAYSASPGNIADTFVTISVSVIRSVLRPCLLLVLLLGRDSNICTQPQPPSSTTKHYGSRETPV